MPAILAIRPVLLTAPYGPASGNLEVLLHLPHGLRTTGLVEIRLDDGTVGLGEGYLAVFAPEVFVATVELVAPLLLGRDIADLAPLLRDLDIATGYWSHQGAARHVVSAIEIALQDCRAQLLDQPLWQALGGDAERPLRVYASGGDAVDPAHMAAEIAEVARLGIDTLKIRARAHQPDKATWCHAALAPHGADVAIDMTQNLAVPSQSAAEIKAFLARYRDATGVAPAFLEEIQGPADIAQLPGLRTRLGVPVAGGEIVTTPRELCERVAAGCYDIAQPDATVIGGVGAVLEIFAAAPADIDVFVHCWGAGVGMLANYHAALAGGGNRVEWPLPPYELRAALFADDIEVRDGQLRLPSRPGLGARLTPDIEARFPYRPEATYSCLVDAGAVPAADWR